MKLPSKVYDCMKWITLILLPAATTLYVTVAPVVGWGYADEVAKISVAVCTFLGAILGISTAQYNKDDMNDYTGIDYDDDIYWDDDEDQEEGGEANGNE